MAIGRIIIPFQQTLRYIPFRNDERKAGIKNQPVLCVESVFWGLLESCMGDRRGLPLETPSKPPGNPQVTPR